MSESIIVALIASFGGIIANIITNISNRNKITAEIKTSQAITQTELGSLKEDFKDLRSKVDQHNSFGLQITELRTRLQILEGRVN